MRDMTQGSPIKLIIMFTIPLLIGNIFQQFYNMADTLIVGRTIGVNAPGRWLDRQYFVLSLALPKA